MSDTDLPAIAKQLKTLDRADIKNWLRRGELLTQARELNPNDDAFRKWLRVNGLSKTTAYKAMAAWRDFGDCPASGQFRIEAMALLAQNAQARDAAIELAGSKTITKAIAKDLLAKHGPPAFDAITLVTPTPATRLPLSKLAAEGYEEVFNIEGSTIAISSPGNPTTSDLLGLVMILQRTLRERMSRAA